MQLKPVFKTVAVLLLLLSGAMFLPCWYAYYQSTTVLNVAEIVCVRAFMTSAGAGFFLSGLFYFAAAGASMKLDTRQSLFVVSLSWVLGAVVGSLPYWLWAQWQLVGVAHPFHSFTNCFFESMSGLTTTGASILSDIPALPKSLLLWRALSHWLGGLGIVVLFVAILPMLGGGQKRLFRFEATGLSPTLGVVRMQDTARRLWFIYMALTLLCLLLVKWADARLEWVDALTFAFSTLSTGGFSIYNQSAGSLSSPAQWVLIAFMFLAGVNFAMYTLIFSRRWQQFWRDPEFRLYIGMTLGATAVIFATLVGRTYMDMAGHTVKAGGATLLRDSFFQVVSIGTSTGFSNANSNSWPLLAQFVLLGLMLVGGCGGSTAGGIKVVRILGALKIIKHDLERVFRPHVVRPVTMGDHVLTDSQQRSLLVYISIILFTAGIGALVLLAIEGNSLSGGITALSASVAMVNNIGPGLEGVGVTHNYLSFTDASKWFMCLLMMVGRLEIFAVLVLFLPNFWKKY